MNIYMRKMFLFSYIFLLFRQLQAYLVTYVVKHCDRKGYWCSTNILKIGCCLSKYIFRSHPQDISNYACYVRGNDKEILQKYSSE